MENAVLCDCKKFLEICLYNKHLMVDPNYEYQTLDLVDKYTGVVYISVCMKNKKAVHIDGSLKETVVLNGSNSCPDVPELESKPRKRKRKRRK